MGTGPELDNRSVDLILGHYCTPHWQAPRHPFLVSAGHQVASDSKLATSLDRPLKLVLESVVKRDWLQLPEGTAPSSMRWFWDVSGNGRVG